MIAATFTPLDGAGNLRLSVVPQIVDKLISWNVGGIFVCGSTGEGPSLSSPERKDLSEAFIASAKGRIKVFVHVGHNSIREARDLAAHAARAGADFISATPPCYFKISSVAALVESLREITSQAPDVPFYYYNIPWLTGVELDMVSFLSLAEGVIPSLRGIKYTTPKIHEFQACLRHDNGKYDLLYGTDEMLLSALAVGAKGFIGSTYNFAAPLYRRIMIAYQRGEMEHAAALQYEVVRMVRVINKYGGLAAQKVMMAMTGVDCGPVRNPLTAIDATRRKTLEADLREIGFFEKHFQEVPTPQTPSGI